MSESESNSVASVHRFGEKVAVYVGTGETVYLTADQAKNLAAALSSCAANISVCKFTDSNFGTETIKEYQ